MSCSGHVLLIAAQLAFLKKTPIIWTLGVATSDPDLGDPLSQRS